MSSTIDESVNREIHEILEKAEQDAPGATEGFAALMGSCAGGAASYAALTSLGTAGLSAAGITSGLGVAGGIVGGGMVAGIGVLAAPVAILGIAGYAIAHKKKKAKMIAALNVAIEKLEAVQRRLMQSSERFKSEIATLETTIETLVKRKKQLA